MRILQVNAVCGYGSSGRNVSEMAKAIEKAGHESFVAYSYGNTDVDNSYCYGSVTEGKIHAVLSRLVGLQGYFSYFSTVRLIKYIKKIKPDIVHLHILHSNNITLTKLLNFLGKNDIATVVTLHDCWYFTGKCMHYINAGCFKWQEGCNKCQRLDEGAKSLFFDFTKKMWNDKKKGFESIKRLGVLGVSNWITNEAKKSFLKCASVIRCVYNWIDTETFKPTESDIREKYGIGKDDFVILSAAASWDAVPERVSDLKELKKMLPNDMKLVMLGRGNENNFSSGIIHIPFLDSTKELAKVYSMADVYFHASREDTFGKVVAEALSCGTPAVVYDTTALPELVGEGCGYVVEKANVKKAFDAITEIKNKGKSFYTDKARKFSVENFSYEKSTSDMLKAYLDVFNTGE